VGAGYGVDESYVSESGVGSAINRGPADRRRPVRADDRGRRPSSRVPSPRLVPAEGRYTGAAGPTPAGSTGVDIALAADRARSTGLAITGAHGTICLIARANDQP
jgi:hypothetical protein